jgi:hypothetical protein
VKYLDVEDESDEGHESGDCCELMPEEVTSYGDVGLGRNIGGQTLSLRSFLVHFRSTSIKLTQWASRFIVFSVTRAS